MIIFYPLFSFQFFFTYFSLSFVLFSPSLPIDGSLLFTMSLPLFLHQYSSNTNLRRQTINFSPPLTHFRPPKTFVPDNQLLHPIPTINFRRPKSTFCCQTLKSLIFGCQKPVFSYQSSSNANPRRQTLIFGRQINRNLQNRVAETDAGSARGRHDPTSQRRNHRRQTYRTQRFDAQTVLSDVLVGNAAPSLPASTPPTVKVELKPTELKPTLPLVLSYQDYVICVSISILFYFSLSSPLSYR